MITWNTETLPESEPYEEECGTYYLVKVERFGPVKAMYLDGEWWVSYLAKLAVPVVGWTELT